MFKCLVIGKANVGKTLFTLNFINYLGFEKIKLTTLKYNGVEKTQEYELEHAKNLLSSDQSYSTSSLQSVDISFPLFNKKKEIKIIDSVGLSEGIENTFKLRKAMLQTLKEIEKSDLIIHIVDLTKDDCLKPDSIDNHIVDYGISAKKYILLANKTDLLSENRSIVRLQKKFEKQHIIPISALNQKGFHNVKTYIRHNI
ncbi:50S ribosome-binding GTPase [Lutibacter sp. B2]|nr:50S ribosome-binding GTPase [Lutibacter sp. B2]